MRGAADVRGPVTGSSCLPYILVAREYYLGICAQSAELNGMLPFVCGASRKWYVETSLARPFSQDCIETKPFQDRTRPDSQLFAIY